MDGTTALCTSTGVSDDACAVNFTLVSSETNNFEKASTPSIACAG